MNTAVDPCRPPGPGLLSNTGTLVAGRLVVALFGWVGSVLIVRTLTPLEMGKFTFIFSVLAMMAIFTDMGIGRVAIAGLRSTTTDRAAFAGTYVVLRAILGLVGYGVAVGFVAIAGFESQLVRLTALAGLVIVMATPSHAYHVAFQAHERLAPIAIAGVVGRGAQLALVATVIVRGGRLAWLLVPAVVAEVIVLLSLAMAAHRLMSFRYVVRPAIWWRLLREAVPLSVGSAMTILYYRADSIMLSKLGDFPAVAAYGVAYKFVDLAEMLPIALTTAALPILVRSAMTDHATFRTEVRRSTDLLTVVGLLLVAGTAVLAEDILRFFYTSTYADAGDALRILMVSAVANFAFHLIVTVLIATETHRRYPLIATGGLIANLALNAVFIPRWSYQGAAAATLLTELAVVLLLARELGRSGSRATATEPKGVWARERLARLLLLTAVAIVIGFGARLVVGWVPAGLTLAGVYLAGLHFGRLLGPGGLRELTADGR